METIFDEWNEYAKKKNLKKREINLDSISSSSKLKIIAITGIRRCGKTSVLLLLHHNISQKKEKVRYVNLEDSRIKNDKNVLNSILKWFGEEGYLLLDEITSVSDWESWLSRNHEMLKGKLKLILSSSRGNLIVPNKPLRGRILSYELYPLSFKEFLDFKKIGIEKTTVGAGKIERQIIDYAIYGGFPEVVLMEEKIEKIRLLNSYFKDIIGLDVAEIAQENISTVELFGKYVINSPYFSASKCLNFFKTLGYKTSKQSILYLENYSKEGYLFFFVPIFSYNIKDKSQYPRKSYLGDTGFMYSINGKIDWGRLYENIVFLELRRRISQNEEINYWKNKAGIENDFVIREGLRVKEIMQVVSELEKRETKDREIKGLVTCAKELDLKNGLIITKDFESEEKVEGIKIRFVPIWKWLLQIK